MYLVSYIIAFELAVVNSPYYDENWSSIRSQRVNVYEHRHLSRGFLSDSKLWMIAELLCF